MSNASSNRFAVDGIPVARLVALALQHVLVMYAGAVAVPLILGGALKLPRDQVAILINADLFACGIATLLQSFGAGPFGIRLPVMMGVTFASVTPMLAMGMDPSLGLPGIYGAVITAGIFGMLAAPFISRLLPFFPSVVTGSITPKVDNEKAKIPASDTTSKITADNSPDSRKITNKSRTWMVR